MYLFLFGILVFAIEILFLNSGLLISLLFSTGFMYFGRKYQHTFLGKVFFVIGGVSVFFTVINMTTFKYAILAAIAYLIMKVARSKEQPERIEPLIEEAEEPLQTIKPWFSNKIFGSQKTPNHSYTWEDVNIQTGIGDTIIDLSNTVLPKGEAIIFVRNIIGNVQILVPYEVEISIQHSAILGTTHILGNDDEKRFNQSIRYQTEKYTQVQQKVKINTSILVGKLEVKRI